jgi:hypothetical protein
MVSLLPKKTFKFRERLKYTPSRIAFLRGRKPVTIVVGLRCRDGLVLCADQKISFPGSHSYCEEKITLIEGMGWCVALGYSGSPLIMNAVKKGVVDRGWRIHCLSCMRPANTGNICITASYPWPVLAS